MTPWGSAESVVSLAQGFLIVRAGGVESLCLTDSWAYKFLSPESRGVAIKSNQHHFYRMDDGSWAIVAIEVRDVRDAWFGMNKMNELYPSNRSRIEYLKNALSEG